PETALRFIKVTRHVDVLRTCTAKEESDGTVGNAGRRRVNAVSFLKEGLESFCRIARDGKATLGQVLTPDGQGICCVGEIDGGVCGKVISMSGNVGPQRRARFSGDH